MNKKGGLKRKDQRHSKNVGLGFKTPREVGLMFLKVSVLNVGAGGWWHGFLWTLIAIIWIFNQFKPNKA